MILLNEADHRSLVLQLSQRGATSLTIGEWTVYIRTNAQTLDTYRVVIKWRGKRIFSEHVKGTQHGIINTAYRLMSRERAKYE